MGCPGDGTSKTGSGDFSSSTSGGFSGSGSCSRTTTHFTKFNFTSDSGGTLNFSTLYGVHTGDWIIVPPTLNSESAPIYMVNSVCPWSNKTLNWIFVQWDSGTRTLQDTYVLGAATYDTSAGLNVTGQYDVTGAAYWQTVTPMPGSCSGGTYTVSGQSDLNGTVYFTADSSGVYKTTLGHATFFFPQYSVNQTQDLGNIVNAQGMSFDSNNETDSVNIAVSTDSTGTYFTVQVYSDPNAGTTSSTYTDTITITQVNSPKNGMLLGTVTRTGTGAGTGSIACIVNRSLDLRVICSGQSPANNSYPYTVAFVQEGLHVLGQPDTMSQTSIALGMGAPGITSTDGTKLYVPDCDNNRILIWNTIPTSNETPADVVVAQPSLSSNAAGVTSQSLSCPWGANSDGTKLYVADYSNNRVLIWNTIPIVNQAPANVVLGQPNMTSSSHGPGSQGLWGPASVYSDGTRLYVVDGGNNRVLIWNTIPTADQAAANLVVGASDMNGTCNGSDCFLTYPSDVYSDGTKLYIADNGGQVFIWNTIPTADQAADFTLDGTAGLVYPATAQSDGSKLYVTDYGSNHVLIWNTMPTSDRAPDITMSAAGFSTPWGAVSDGSKLYVVDYNNNRILIWNAIPTADRTADVVVGQPNMTSTAQNNAGVSGQLLSSVASVYSDGTRLYAADTTNNRVLIWNTIPTSNQVAASLVLGQPNMTSNTASPLTTSSQSLRGPTSVYSDGTRLYVADTPNNRVLIWNTIPTVNQAAASLVLGQANMTGRVLGTSSQSFHFPNSVYGDGTRLYVSDEWNNRVLIWNTIPTATQAAANVVLGQPDMTTGTNGLTSQNMHYPFSVYSDGSKVYVVDNQNERVLIWNTIPTGVPAPGADVVLGQPNMTSNGTGVNSQSLNYPTSVYGDGTRLYVAEQDNSRVLIWNTIPTATQAAANMVLGQPDMTSAGTGLSSQGLSGPVSVYSDGSKVYVGDSANNRIILFPLP